MGMPQEPSLYNCHFSSSDGIIVLELGVIPGLHHLFASSLHWEKGLLVLRVRRVPGLQKPWKPMRLFLLQG